MNMRLIRVVLLGCVGVAGLLPAAKAVSYTNELPGYVWDISGDYTEELDGVYMDYTVYQDGKGKFNGYGYAEYDDPYYGLTVEMDFIVKGGIKGKDGVYYVMEKLSAKGVIYDSWDGEIYEYFKASIIMKAEVDTANNSLSGTVTVKLLGEQLTEFFYEPLDDPSMDGSAIIMTDIDEVDGKLLGTAQIELSNGRIMYCDVKGKEDAKNSMLKIAVKGVKEDPDSSGSKIKMELDLEGVLQAVKAKISGQKIVWEND